MIELGEPLKKTLPVWLVVLVSGVAIVISLPVLSLPDAVFAFNDGAIETRLAEGTHPPGTLLQHWNEQFILGLGLRASTLNTPNLLDWLLGAQQYRRWGVLLSIVFASWAAYAGCRLAGRSKAASFVGGTVAGLCGWTVTFPMAGLPARTWLLGWVFLAVGLITYGWRTGSRLATSVAGGLVGMAIADAPDIGVLAALCCGLYFIVLHWSSKSSCRGPSALRWVVSLAAAGIVCGLVASQAVINMFELYVKAPREAATEQTSSGGERSYEWATQWSLPFNETWSLIACDYHGASSRSATDPYWGRMGESRGPGEHSQGYRNFKLSGYALGTVPVVLILFGWVCARAGATEERTIFFIANLIALLCLMLSWGRYHLAYRLLFELPVMSSIRNPEKWMFGFVVFATLAAAGGLDLVGRSIDAPGRQGSVATVRTWGAAAVLPALLLLNLLLLASRADWLAGPIARGFEGVAETAHANSLQALLIALLCATVSGTVVACALQGKRSRSIPAIAAVLVAMSVVELAAAAAPYAMPYHYKHMLEPNPLISILESNAPDNRVKVMPPNHGLLNHLRLTWLRARGLKLFDPVSVRTMPDDYAAVLARLGDNPLALWRLGAVRWFICTQEVAALLVSQAPGRFAAVATFTFTRGADGAIRPVLIPGFRHDLSCFVLLEHHAALPYARISRSVTTVETRDAALRGLAEADPRSAWVDYVEARGLSLPRAEGGGPGSVAVVSESPVELRLRTESEAAGLLIVAEKYDPHWTAEVSGAPTPIFRADGILQSVLIPAGRHDVTLRYRPPRYPLCLSLAGRGGLAILIVLLAVSRFREGRRAAG